MKDTLPQEIKEKLQIIPIQGTLSEIATYAFKAPELAYFFVSHRDEDFENIEVLYSEIVNNEKFYGTIKISFPEILEEKVNPLEVAETIKNDVERFKEQHAKSKL
ncbi:hypothetical protein [Chryseobacterium sp. JV274]|uniref:hypothetical protein n=1 Tax=Chryseobacterium sp. JV274 TaxID=1932669 RepID=UPI000986B10E|nr:hypothetical protein [Chryseobacterium sp. JV274]